MNVTVFGAPWCAFCHTEMEWLDSKSVEYKYIDVEANDSDIERVVQLSGGSGIPVTLIEFADDKKHVVRGFDRKELSKHLGL